MGFPIRKSSDQRVFAPPRRLSQRITSFIACACQGIHQLPLRHLIILIANAHPDFSRRYWQKRPASRDLSSGAVRQTIICRGLRVHDDGPEPEQIFSLRCHAEQAEGRGFPQTCFPSERTLIDPSESPENGGAGRDRTDDILLAKQALSQLSYGP